MCPVFSRIMQILCTDVMIEEWCSNINGPLSTFYTSIYKQKKLQCIQNHVTLIVSNNNRYSGISPVRKDLHWLPVEQRSIFKTMTLVYKFLHAGVPKYFGSYISPQQSVYNTRRCQNQGSYLVVP